MNIIYHNINTTIYNTQQCISLYTDWIRMVWQTPAPPQTETLTMAVAVTIAVVLVLVIIVTAITVTAVAVLSTLAVILCKWRSDWSKRVTCYRGKYVRAIVCVLYVLCSCCVRALYSDLLCTVLHYKYLKM